MAPNSGSLHGEPVASFIRGTGTFAEGLAVVLASKNTVNIATSATQYIMWIVYGAVDTVGGGSTLVAVKTTGFVKAKLGGTVTAWAKLTVTTGGKLIATTTDGNLVCGIAMEWGVADEFIEVWLTPANEYGALVSPVYNTTTTILTAAVLTLNTTPVELVPAPGAGYAIEVLSIVGSIDYNSAAYATNVTMEFRYTDASGTKVTADMATLLDASADKFVSVKGIESALVLTANAAIVTRVATGNPATGNSPIKLHVAYRVIAL